MLEIVNYPEVSERLGWTPVLLRYRLYAVQTTTNGSRRLKRLRACMLQIIIEHLHFEPGNRQAFCTLPVVDCL